MRTLGFLSCLAVCLWSASALGVEGPTAAGPLGGTDIRSAQLPPPGLYGGTFAGWAEATEFVDGKGNLVAGLDDAHLNRGLVAPFFTYVPNVEVLGGSVAFSAILPGGESCGHLFAGTPTECLSAIGDLYVEADWSRGFGFWRPSQYAGAAPIFEGLSVLLGFGVVFPTGEYDAALSYGSGPVIGTNIYDFAPSIAINYVTPPILADGTEFAAKLYWNNYTENGDTNYHSGQLISIDFAMTERIGLVQAGITGTYSKQIEDDRFNGIPISPDGRRFEVLTLGGVVQVDIPELKAAVRAKAVSTVHVENSVESWGITLAWLQAF